MLVEEYHQEVLMAIIAQNAYPAKHFHGGFSKQLQQYHFFLKGSTNSHKILNLTFSSYSMNDRALFLSKHKALTLEF